MRFHNTCDDNYVSFTIGAIMSDIPSFLRGKPVFVSREDFFKELFVNEDTFDVGKQQLDANLQKFYIVIRFEFVWGFRADETNWEELRLGHKFLNWLNANEDDSRLIWAYAGNELD